MNKFDEYLEDQKNRRLAHQVECEDDADEEAPTQRAGILVSYKTFLIFTICSILAVLNLALVIWVEGDKISAKAQATWRQLRHQPTAVVQSYEPPSSTIITDDCDDTINDGATCERITY